MNQKTVLLVFVGVSLFTFLISDATQTSFFAIKNIPNTNLASESLGIDWWPMFRHDLSHMGFSTSDAPNTNETLWIYETRHQIMSSPAVFGGVVFIGSHDHNLYALNATMGLLIWKYETDGTIFSSPSVQNGKVFVGSSDGKLYALNVSTGEYIWSFEFWGLGHSSPAVAGGKVFIGSGFDHKVYALDENTGLVLWNFTTGGAILSSPAIANDMVFVGSSDDKIYALYANTGGFVWSYTTGDSIYSSPCVADDKVFIGSNDGNVYALNAETGSLVWSFATYPHGVSNTVSSSPAFSEGKVFFGARMAYPGNDWPWTFYALDAETGISIWNYTRGGYDFSSPAVAGGKVFVMDYGGGVHALNTKTGAVVWYYNTGGSASTSSPAVANGRVYVGSGNGKVYSFGPMLYFNITVDPRFYDNRGEPLVPSPSSWTILFPNGTRKMVSSETTFYGPMGTYSIESVVWKGYQVLRQPASIFMASNITWNPKIDCILPTNLSLSLSSSTSYVGFKIEINGNLTCNEEGVLSAPILLSYSATTGQSWNDITLINTTSNGRYSAVWMPQATGNYIVKAIWSGNSTYPGTSATVSLAVIPFEEQSVFSVTSNSTISALAFNSTGRELSFTVTGPSGTTGYVNVYIAKTLVGNVADVKVYLNGNQLNYTATSLDDSWLLHFTYLHSTKKITITLGEVSVPFIETLLGKAVIFTVASISAIVILVLFILKKKLGSERK